MQCQVLPYLATDCNLVSGKAAIACYYLRRSHLIILTLTITIETQVIWLSGESNDSAVKSCLKITLNDRQEFLAMANGNLRLAYRYHGAFVLFIQFAAHDNVCKLRQTD